MNIFYYYYYYNLYYFSIIFTRIEHIKHISRLALFFVFYIYFKCRKTTTYPAIHFQNIAINYICTCYNAVPWMPAFKSIITYLTKILNMIFQCYFSNWCTACLFDCQWTIQSSLTSVFILIAESGKEGGGRHTGGQKRIQRVWSDPM